MCTAVFLGARVLICLIVHGSYCVGTQGIYIIILYIYIYIYIYTLYIYIYMYVSVQLCGFLFKLLTKYKLLSA